MNYLPFMVARMEYERMVRSLPSVPEYGYHLAPKQPGWSSRQAGRLLSALRNGLAALRSPIKQPHNTPLDAALVD